jgi:hypothetical protein
MVINPADALVVVGKFGLILVFSSVHFVDVIVIGKMMNYKTKARWFPSHKLFWLGKNKYHPGIIWNNFYKFCPSHVIK